MAMCRECKKVVSVQNIREGLCNDCRDKELSLIKEEMKKKENAEKKWQAEHPASKPGLTVCKGCEREISRAVKQCIHCGEEHSLAEENKIPKTQDELEYIKLMKKSREASFLLTLFFGPLGMLYSNVVIGAIMILITLALAWTIVVPIIMWILSMILGDSYVISYNRKLNLGLNVNT